MTRAPYVVFVSLALYHLFQSAMIIADPAARKVTSLHSFHFISGDWDVYLMIVAALTASIVIFVRKQVVAFALVLPQQLILCIVAFGALSAIQGRSFADGVERPMAFMAADQGIYILVAAMHLWAVCWRLGVRR